ncbi:pyridoxal phosphate-dependent aminotransferase [Methyloligella sp. 2.7D]|uniref:pyridoxal phosphate-dependent aminotransferase n=1 Tax=unclassified Methyloligella TaxID=2625955 RepID=UPI00157D2D51|nr:pyridoxal phosphate-dependent aminotransferase [Methyloligella sp. GL2]QKP77150.1 pyridoxal phosphate-dependent aminotransferase [Methyloligella sp. GL2]
MKNFEIRNAHFDHLVNTPGMKWLGQNTNHATPHPSVIAAMQKSIRDEEFHIYAPPAGLEELRAGIIGDLGLQGQSVLISDGAVSALSHICNTLLSPGDELLTTDPTWNWPMSFAQQAGATVSKIPIYGAEYGYRLAPERLAAAITDKTRVIYFVDPNNPLGTVATRDEIAQIAEIARDAGAYLIHDSTYRHFAYEHHLASRFYPEGTLTTYSFSKWLGLAGLRIGAVVGSPDLIERLAVAPPNNLGSSILAQRAAIAGLASKEQWFPQVLKDLRLNQELVREAVEAIPGLSLPVYPSNGNFLVVECDETGIDSAALASAYQPHDIMIRQGAYHTEAFGRRFIKVSLTVPREWVEAFVALLPEMLETARGKNEELALF